MILGSHLPKMTGPAAYLEHRWCCRNVWASSSERAEVVLKSCWMLVNLDASSPQIMEDTVQTKSNF